MDKERFDKLLAAFSENRLTPEEQAELEEVLKHSWLESNHLYGHYPPTSEGRRRIRRILRKVPRRRVMSRPWVVAASILLPLFILGTWLGVRYTDLQRPEVIVVQAGEAQDIALPDGTLVHLFAGAKLTYPEDFATNRSVHLDGEAFFDVAKDGQHPFWVQAGPIRTEVLGTAFEVRMGQHGMPLVRVHRGRVRVLASKDARILGKNEQVQFQDDKLWHTALQADPGGFEFHVRNEPLSYLTSILTNRFDVDIRIQSPAMQQERITTTFDTGDSLADLLDIISLASGLEWQQHNNTIRFQNKDK